MATSVTNKPKRTKGATKPLPSKKQNSFENILKDAISRGITSQNQKKSLEWFRSRASKTKETPKSVMDSLIKNAGNSAELGSMYFFSYDPKTKNKMPYWDEFPLIFVIQYYSNGFLGINFHYLPPYMRVRLMDALYDLISNDKYDNTTKLKISYEILNSASQYKYFKPAVKRYLTAQLRSKMFYVSPIEWSTALFLPVSQFRYANEQRVYADSIKKIG